MNDNSKEVNIKPQKAIIPNVHMVSGPDLGTSYHIQTHSYDNPGRIISHEFDVTVFASLDDIKFQFLVTRDGMRMIVSMAIRCLMHSTAWEAIQKTCVNLQPASNQRSSVPTDWFMTTTANPPSFVLFKNRRILRLVHLICRDAKSMGANFKTDQVFSRTTPILQIELNLLESPTHWSPPIEFDTKNGASIPLPLPKRRFEYQDHEFRNQTQNEEPSTKRARDTSTALIRYPTEMEAMAYLTKWSDHDALDALGLMKTRGLMMLMSGTTSQEFQVWLSELSQLWLDIKKIQMISEIQLPLENARLHQEQAKAEQEKAKAEQEISKAEQEQEKTKQEQAKTEQESQKTLQCDLERKTALINNRACDRADKIELWKAQNAKKERDDQKYSEFQREEFQRKQTLREDDEKRKQQARVNRLEEKARELELEHTQKERELALNRQKRLDEITLEAAQAELGKKQQTSKGMQVPLHGLPMVRNSPQIIADTFRDKMGVITCQARSGICPYSVMLLAPKIILYKDEEQPRVVCTPCATMATSADQLAARSDMSISDNHRRSWLNRHGFVPSAACHLCEQGPLIVILGGWNCLHDIPSARVTDKSYKNVFIGHEKCNELQDTSLIDDFRRVKHALPPVDRTPALVAPAGSKVVNDALSFAFDHRNREQSVRTRLKTLVLSKTAKISGYMRSLRPNN